VKIDKRALPEKMTCTEFAIQNRINRYLDSFSAEQLGRFDAHEAFDAFNERVPAIETALPSDAFQRETLPLRIVLVAFEVGNPEPVQQAGEAFSILLHEKRAQAMAGYARREGQLIQGIACLEIRLALEKISFNGFLAGLMGDEFPGGMGPIRQGLLPAVDKEKTYFSLPFGRRHGVPGHGGPDRIRD
jgi:hypothetical protein